MSPEQIEGKPADSRSDVFAFGAVLYEMLTGNKMFPGTDQRAIAAAILAHDAARLPALPSSAPTALDRLVRKCLATDPDDRWQSAGDLASALEWIAQDGAAGREVATTPGDVSASAVARTRRMGSCRRGRTGARRRRLRP